MSYVPASYHRGDSPLRRDSREIYANEFVVLMIRAGGLKATPLRIKIMELLLDEQFPMSSLAIAKKTLEICNRATLYRTLDQFFDADLIVRVDFKDGQTHYEARLGKRHHHHVICSKCRDVEDVNDCPGHDLNDLARNGLKKFRKVGSHSLEYFGVCRKCEAK